MDWWKRWFWFWLLFGALVLVWLAVGLGVKSLVSTADSYVPHCQKRMCKIHVARSYRTKFLAPVGACESGTDHWLRHGLDATSPGGYYLGRYQFGMPDWHRAGGAGDPRRAPWYEQAYRAVRWLHINGRQSWPNC